MKKTAPMLIRSAAACGAAYLLLTSQLLASPPRRDTAAAKPREILPVYPREAEGLPVTNLADLVVAVIPAQGFEHLGWDYMIDSPLIDWITDGVSVTETGYAFREGLARVTVGGQTSTRIGKVREELAWTVTLLNPDGTKWGPKWISLQAGKAVASNLTNDYYCFGSLYDGCNFTASQALGSPTLTKQKICNVSEFGEHKEVYTISTFGKVPSLFVYKTGGGSGGTITSLQIRPMSDKANACKSFN